MTVNCIDKTIQSIPRLVCILCGAKGEILYDSLYDRLFAAQGEWNLRRCPNQTCNLIWLDTLLTENEIAKAYAKYYTHQNKNLHARNLVRSLYSIIKEGYFSLKYHYNNDSINYWKKLLGVILYFHPLQRVAIDLTLMYLHSNVTGYLLDVGCGSGKRLKLLQDLGWHVEGVDIDPIAVERAKVKGLNTRLGKLEDQNYPNNYFDAITMSHVIEHIHEPLRLLCDCYRILKPGGRIVMVTPNGESWGHRLFKDAWIHLDPPRHLYIFSSKVLRQLVEKAGFRNIRTFTTLQWNDITFQGSKSIKHTGKFLDFTPTWNTRLWAGSMELIEYAILKVRPNFGEELVLLAEK